MKMDLSRGLDGYWNDQLRTAHKGCKQQSYGQLLEGILPVVAPTESKMLTISMKMAIGLKYYLMEIKIVKHILVDR